MASTATEDRLRDEFAEQFAAALASQVIAKMGKITREDETDEVIELVVPHIAYRLADAMLAYRREHPAP